MGRREGAILRVMDRWRRVSMKGLQENNSDRFIFVYIIIATRSLPGFLNPAVQPTHLLR